MAEPCVFSFKESVSMLLACGGGKRGVLAHRAASWRCGDESRWLGLPSRPSGTGVGAKLSRSTTYILLPPFVTIFTGIMTALA